TILKKSTVYVETVDADGNFVYDLGESEIIELPNGKALKVGKNSSEKKIFDFLMNSNNTESGWITLDRVMFKSGSSELTSESSEQLRNLAGLLRTFPDAQIKIGGYTDNVGDDQVNLNVSTERANAVKAMLSKRRIEESRLQAEGYGANHFICEANDTDICKAKNRRVDIKIQAK